MFQKKQDAARIRRAETEVRRMGYEFHAPAVTIREGDVGTIEVSLEIENRGVAPFYYDWKPEYGLIAGKKVVKTWAGSGKLTGLRPGDKPRVWVDKLALGDLPAGKSTLAVRVANPLKNGPPLRFANAEQDRDLPGWLSLGTVAQRRDGGRSR
jgi:hypothetical protein